MNNINKSPDVNYPDIYTVKRFVETEILQTKEIDRSVQINYMPGFEHIKYLTEEMCEIMSGKRLINNRKTNYLIFYYGIPPLLRDIDTVIKLKSLVKKINLAINSKNKMEFKIEKILGMNTDKVKQNKDKFHLFLTKKQMDQLKLIKDILGVRHEGTVAILIWAYSVNSAFRDEDLYKKYRVKKIEEYYTIEDGTEYLHICGYYYRDNGFLNQIRNAIARYENDLMEYISMTHEYMKIQEHDNGDEGVNSYLPNLISEIEKLGLVKFKDSIDNILELNLE